MHRSPCASPRFMAAKVVPGKPAKHVLVCWLLFDRLEGTPLFTFIPLVELRSTCMQHQSGDTIIGSYIKPA